jgi:hypothetical protein
MSSYNCTLSKNNEVSEQMLLPLTEYTIILRPDDNRTYVAYIPAIKGCHAWGETPEEACS